MPITITFSTAGSFTVEDDGVPGNNTSIVRRDSDGVILAFIPHPADLLAFRAVVPGVNLTFNFTDSLGNASLTVGSLTNSAETPDLITVRSINSAAAVTLVSNGAIVEGGADAATDIVANALILSAGAGVGTAGNAIETQTVQLEAETNTGGINLANVGNLNVGGFSAAVDGLDVVTSGDIRLTNLGSITLADETSFDSVHGGDSSGNVTLIANGYDSDLSSIVDQSSIIAPRGGIFLTAGRDVSFGLAGTEFGNDVRANNDIVVNAGRDFLVSGFADFFANGVLGNTGGDLIATAGRDISILDDTGNSGSLAVLGSSGDVILTTGLGGRLTVEPPSTNAITSGAGSIIVNADRIILGATTGITAPGSVTLRPVSEGRAISLGSLSDGANALELSDGELDRIFANTLILGSDTAGPINVGAPIAPANVQNFTLRSGSDIFINSGLTANTLSLLAQDNVFQVAASTIGAATLIVSADVGDSDPGFGASVIMDGAITGTNTINGNEDADALNGSGQANSINGFGGNDTLRGFAGADTLDGGTGVDTMLGGLGDDFYFVDNGGDVVTEAAGEGNDRIFTSVSYELAAGSAVDILSTTANAGTAALMLTGNALANTLIGNAGANVLTGAGGGDVLIGFGGDDTLVGNADAPSTLQGGTGNDTYRISNASDTLVEVAGEGNDRIQTSLSFVLTSGREIESIFAADPASTAALNLTGNGVGQVIFGNAGANVLTGGGGGDYMIGGGGNDTLFGNADANSTLQGGTGDDSYFVSRTGDSLVEFAAEGSDRVLSSVTYTLTAGKEIEILSTTSTGGTGALNLTGNEFAQTIIGNNGANILSGAGAADNLAGFGEADILVGGAGNDILNGGAGNDILNGGANADTFIFAEALGAGNVDLVQDFVSGLDRLFLENAVFTGLATGALPGGAFRTGGAALDADDRIIYNNANGALLFDADGDGAGAAIQFATLSGAPALGASDFVVI